MAVAANWYEIIDGYKSMRSAKKKLAAMDDPKYRSGLEIEKEARANAQGFAPAQRAQFFQSLARANNASFSRAQQVNPSSSSAVAAAIGFTNSSALNQFAAQDANLMERDAAQLAASIRAQSNLMTNLDIKTQENLGLQYQQSRDRMIRGMKEKSQDVQSFSTMGAGNFGRMTGGNKSTTETGTPYYGTPYQQQPAYEQPTYTDYSQPYYKY